MSYLSQAEVGRRIAALRAERGISQRGLAAAMDVDASALSRVESGERGLGVGELVAIAECLGVETDALLRREPESAPLFRHDGDDDRARAAVREVADIIDDFFTFEAAARN